MDADFDVADFGQIPSVVTVQLQRTVRSNLEEGTQFEILYSPLNITNIEGLEMWVDAEEVAEGKKNDGSACVACMKLLAEF